MTSKLDTCNCIYQFRCLFNKQYVGMTKRTLRMRAIEHRTPSSAKKAYHHINQCPTYISKWQEFEGKNVPPNTQVTFIKKMRDKFLMDHFKILQKNFRNYFERRNAEAFFIRIFKPTLNDQCKHRNFSLF